MKIVHVVCTEAFAGVERHVARLATAQVAAGDRVVVVGGHPDAMASQLPPTGVRHLAGPSTVAAALALRRLRDADVVNVHMTAAEVAAAVALPPGGPPVVSTRHFAQRRGRSVLTRGAVTLTARRVDAQIAVSRFVAARVEGPSTVVLAGVPEPGAAPPGAARQRVVLVAQRLEQEKSTDVALRAFAAAGLHRSGWVLHVAGEGALRPSLVQLAHTLGLDGAVRFLGHRSDVERLMDRSAIALAPAPLEPYGLTVVEAMSRSLPVVAAGAGGHLETVGRVGGAALFPPGDVEAAAGLLGSLAADADARTAYGEALRAHQREHLSVEVQARATDAVYRGVL